MSEACPHLDQIRYPAPKTDGCEECLKMGDQWVHLRLCETCGHVGCCDSSKNRHATKHFHKTKHPIMRSSPVRWWRSSLRNGASCSSQSSRSASRTPTRRRSRKPPRGDVHRGEPSTIPSAMPDRVTRSATSAVMLT